MSDDHAVADALFLPLIAVSRIASLRHVFHACPFMSLRQRHLQVVGRLLSSITPNPATYPSLSGLDWLCLSLSAHRHYSTLAETLGCPDQYHKVGQIKERLFPERKPIFAVVEVGPTQFKVSADDLIYAEKLSGVDVNDRISLNRVLMLGSHAETVIGRPYVPDASVIAAIEVSSADISKTSIVDVSLERLTLELFAGARSKRWTRR